MMALDRFAIPILFKAEGMEMLTEAISNKVGRRLLYRSDTQCIDWGGKPENAFQCSQLKNGDFIFYPAYKAVREAMGSPITWEERRTCSNPTCTSPWHRTDS
jgi:hypothetical protein